jgi:quercetin dioxygenase-like cupin family protein
VESTIPKEVIVLGQIEIRYLLEGSDTKGALAQFEVVVPPDVRVPAPRRHVTYDETIYGLAGTCTFVVEGREFPTGVGESIFIPRGAAHYFQNRGMETARFLATVTPGVLSLDYFREIRALMSAGGPPDLKRLSEIMLRHGLEAA